MKPTQKNLAEYLEMSEFRISKMKKQRPEMFQLLWDGWVLRCASL